VNSTVDNFEIVERLRPLEERGHQLVPEARCRPSNEEDRVEKYESERLHWSDNFLTGSMRVAQHAMEA
jgi:hypothetical protein